jgi:hypothetical protein
MNKLKHLGKNFKIRLIKINYLTFSSNEQTLKSEPQGSPIDIKEKEKEWNKIYISKIKQKIDFLQEELTDQEKREVEVFFKKFMKLSQDEKKYLIFLNKKNTNNKLGFDFTKVNTFHPSNLMQTENTWPKENPNWYKTENMSSTVGAFTGKASTGNNIIFRFLN